ncbi:histidine phosphatase superfamily [Dichotomopilus funicola]|uniref:Histidine phosphatase superfamily n=1 Tax=Dichotomopilus funicola TaxID=1934379 RepID=A0AAN6ZQE2_9PEZI|nr:histidine phosphatase superfamily [Dichotomopilus funicola]
MLETIYVTRHGFRSNWLVDPSNGSYTSFLKSPTGLAADPTLTAHGVDQANELAAKLLTLDPPVERVYSSMYYRCLQTIEPFVREAQRRRQRRTPRTQQTQPQAAEEPGTGGRSPPLLKIRGETGLGEWYGSADFEHPAPASIAILDPLFPDLIESDYEPMVTPNRKGEGIDELHDRVAAAMEAVVAQCDRDGVRTVLLCSHAAVIIALGRVLTGEMPESIETDDFQCFTCGLSEYRRRGDLGGQRSDVVASGRPTAVSKTNHGSKDANVNNWRGGRGVSGGWICLLNSDCKHLSLGEERGWRFLGDESFKSPETGQSMLGSTVAPGSVSQDRDKSERSREEATRGKL